MITLVTNAHAHVAPGQPPGPPHGQPSGPDQPVCPSEAIQSLWPQSLPPQAQEALLYGLAKLAIDFVSGPGGIASALRRSLLGAQLNSKSVPLDVG